MAYRKNHKSIGPIFPNAEYEEIKAFVEARGGNITGFARQAVRDSYATAKEAEALIPSLVPAEN